MKELYRALYDLISNTDRMELYKAVKYECIHFPAEVGYDIPGLWAAVNGKNGARSQIFWIRTCLDDYRAQRV